VLELFAWTNRYLFLSLYVIPGRWDVEVLGGKRMKERQGTKEILLFGGEKEYFFKVASLRLLSLMVGEE